LFRRGARSDPCASFMAGPLSGRPRRGAREIRCKSLERGVRAAFLKAQLRSRAVTAPSCLVERGPAVLAGRHGARWTRANWWLGLLKQAHSPGRDPVPDCCCAIRSPRYAGAPFCVGALTEAADDDRALPRNPARSRRSKNGRAGNRREWIRRLAHERLTVAGCGPRGPAPPSRRGEVGHAISFRVPPKSPSALHAFPGARVLEKYITGRGLIMDDRLRGHGPRDAGGGRVAFFFRVHAAGFSAAASSNNKPISVKDRRTALTIAAGSEWGNPQGPDNPSHPWLLAELKCRGCGRSTATSPRNSASSTYDLRGPRQFRQARRQGRVIDDKQGVGADDGEGRHGCRRASRRPVLVGLVLCGAVRISELRHHAWAPTGRSPAINFGREPASYQSFFSGASSSATNLKKTCRSWALSDMGGQYQGDPATSCTGLLRETADRGRLRDPRLAFNIIWCRRGPQRGLGGRLALDATEVMSKLKIPGCWSRTAAQEPQFSKVGTRPSTPRRTIPGPRKLSVYQGVRPNAARFYEGRGAVNSHRRLAAFRSELANKQDELVDMTLQRLLPPSSRLTAAEQRVLGSAVRTKVLDLRWFLRGSARWHP